MAPEDLPSILRQPARWLAHRFARRVRPQPCPKCGALVAIPRPLPDTLWETRLDCMNCGHAMALPELAAHGADVRVEDQVSAGLITVEKPPSTRILQAETAAERVWDIPAKGGINFLIVFGTIWLLFCAVFNVLAFSGQERGKALWGLIFFIGVFDLAGLGMLYAGLRMAFTRHRLRLTPSELTLESCFAGWVSRKSVSPPDVTGVELAVFYTQNYEPVYGIEIQGGQKKIRFGSVLSTEEKTWLCQEIRVALGLAAEAQNAASTQIEMAEPPPADDVRGEARIVLPPVSGLAALWIIGAIFILVPGFMLYQGVNFMELDRDGLFFVLSNAFALIWCIGPALFILIGVAVLCGAWTMSRTHVEIVATRDNLSIQTRTGTRRREECWGVHEVQAVRADTSANWRQNGEKKSVSALYIVLPDRVRCLGTGQPPAELEAAASKLRRALGLAA